MPDYCKNFICIEGSVKSMKQIYKFFSENEDSNVMEYLIPMEYIPNDQEIDFLNFSGKYRNY